MPVQYKLCKSTMGHFYYKLTAENNKVILTSEMYFSKSSAQSGIASCQNNSSNEARYVRFESKNGKYYFYLRANNNQVIGTSEMYASAASRDKGIETVKRVSPNAPTIDDTEFPSRN